MVIEKSILLKYTLKNVQI